MKTTTVNIKHSITTPRGVTNMASANLSLLCSDSLRRSLSNRVTEGEILVYWQKVIIHCTVFGYMYKYSDIGVNF